MNKEAITIENWAVSATQDRIQIYGTTATQPEITTSSVVAFDESTMTVTTKSGSRYRLGKVSEEYARLNPAPFLRLQSLSQA